MISQVSSLPQVRLHGSRERGHRAPQVPGHQGLGTRRCQVLPGEAGQYRIFGLNKYKLYFVGLQKIVSDKSIVTSRLMSENSIALTKNFQTKCKKNFFGPSLTHFIGNDAF